MTRRDGRTAKAARLKWAATALAGALVAGPALAAEPAGDWRSYGRDVGGQHYSPLTEITPANVSRLATRWLSSFAGWMIEMMRSTPSLLKVHSIAAADASLAYPRPLACAASAQATSTPGHPFG